MSEMLINEPTLVVGLGKYGTDVVRKLKQRIRIRLPGRQRIRLLCLDFFDADGETTDQVLAPHEVFTLSMRGVREFCSVQGMDNLFAEQNILQELDEESKPILSAHAHFAFAKHASQVKARMSELLTQLLSPLEQVSLSQQPTPATAEISVFVISSLCDRRGSGIVLDFVKLLASLRFPVEHGIPLRIRALLMLPHTGGAEANLQKAQAYATLRELFAETNQFKELSTETKQFASLYSYGCFLIGDSNESKPKVKLDSSAIESTIAEWLYQLIAAPIGAGVVQNPPLDFPSNSTGVASPFTASGLGFASYQIPVRDIVRYCGARWAVKKLSDALALPEDRAKQAVTEAFQKITHNWINEANLEEQIDPACTFQNSILEETLPVHRVRLEDIPQTATAGITRFEQTGFNQYATTRQTRRFEIASKGQTLVTAQADNLLNELPKGSVDSALQFLRMLESHLFTFTESVSREQSQYLGLIAFQQQRVNTSLELFPSMLALYVRLRMILYALGAAILFCFIGLALLLPTALLFIALAAVLFLLFLLMFQRWHTIRSKMLGLLFDVRELMRMRMQLLKIDVLRHCANDLSIHVADERAEIERLGTVLGQLIGHFELWERIIVKLENPPTQINLVKEEYTAIYEKLLNGKPVKALTGEKTIDPDSGWKISAWRDTEMWDLVDPIWDNASERFRIIESADVSKLFFDYCQGSTRPRLTEQEIVDAEVQNNFIPSLNPLWDYRDVFEGSRLQYLLGVPDASASLIVNSWRNLLGPEPRIISTQDRHAIVALAFRHTVPLRAISSIMDYQWSYMRAPDKISLHTQHRFIDAPLIVGEDEAVWITYIRAKSEEEVIDNELMSAEYHIERAQRQRKAGNVEGSHRDAEKAIENSESALEAIGAKIGQAIERFLKPCQNAAKKLIQLLAAGLPSDLRVRALRALSTKFAANSEYSKVRLAIAAEIKEYWANHPEAFVLDVRKFLEESVPGDFFSRVARFRISPIERICQSIYELHPDQKKVPTGGWNDSVSRALVAYRDFRNELKERSENLQMRIEKGEDAGGQLATDLSTVNDAIPVVEALEEIYSKILSLLMLSPRPHSVLVEIEEPVSAIASEPFREFRARLSELFKILSNFSCSPTSREFPVKLLEAKQELENLGEILFPEHKLLDVVIEHLHWLSTEALRLGPNRPVLELELLDSTLDMHSADKEPHLGLRIHNVGKAEARDIALRIEDEQLFDSSEAGIWMSPLKDLALPIDERQVIFVKLKPFLELRSEPHHFRVTVHERLSDPAEKDREMKIELHREGFSPTADNPYVERARQLLIRSFTSSDSLADMLYRPVKDLQPAISFGNGAIAQIEEMSGGIPYFVNIIAKQLVEFKNHARFMRPFTAWDVEYVARILIEFEDQSIRAFWNLLSPHEQWGILAVVRGIEIEAEKKRKARWLSLSDFGEALIDVLYTSDVDILGILRDLIVIGMVEVNRNESLVTLRSLLLSRWVERHLRELRLSRGTTNVVPA